MTKNLSSLLILAALCGAVRAQPLGLSTTVSVLATSALPGQPGAPFACATPPVDAGLPLPPGTVIRVRASGHVTVDAAGTIERVNGCCLHAEFVDATGQPIVLDPMAYPAVFPFAQATPPNTSIVHPIPPGTPPVNVNATDVITGCILPIPAGAASIRFGFGETSPCDNAGAFSVRTTLAGTAGAFGTGSQRLEITQSGPGAPAFITSSGLFVGGEYYNLFSLDLCPEGPGYGSVLGFCPTSLAFLASQFTTPVGTPPFHYMATAPTQTFGPVPVVPGITFDAVCFERNNGFVGCASPVIRYTTR